MNRWLIQIILVALMGCRPNFDEGPDLSPLEEYKLANEWKELKDSFPAIYSPNYYEAIKKYGKPSYEFDDTVIHGNNIKTHLPDYDLYPLTLERDSVFVHRCWWFLSYRRWQYLYLVFECSADSMPAIYGYKY